MTKTRRKSCLGSMVELHGALSFSSLSGLTWWFSEEAPIVRLLLVVTLGVLLVAAVPRASTEERRSAS